MKTPPSVSIDGKRWRLQFVPLPSGLDGDIDPPKAKHKTIRIRRALLRKPRELLETVIHEALHAADSSKDELWVGQIADDLAALLWRLGYRMEKEQKCQTRRRS